MRNVHRNRPRRFRRIAEQRLNLFCFQSVLPPEMRMRGIYPAPKTERRTICAPSETDKSRRITSRRTVRSVSETDGLRAERRAPPKANQTFGGAFSFKKNDEPGAVPSPSQTFRFNFEIRGSFRKRSVFRIFSKYIIIKYPQKYGLSAFRPPECGFSARGARRKILSPYFRVIPARLHASSRTVRTTVHAFDTRRL